MKERIEKNKELGIISKKLATIILDAPVEFNEEKIIVGQPNVDDIKGLFQELEFRRLTQTFLKHFTNDINSPKLGQQAIIFDDTAKTNNQENISSPSQMQNITSKEHWYQLVETPLARQLLLENLLKVSEVCFDTETTGLNEMDAELVGIAFSYEIGKGYYLVLPDNFNQTKSILNDFLPFFSSKEILIIGHNLKFDLKILYKYNIVIQNPLFDTMVAHYLIEPDMRHNLSILSENYLNYSTIPITSLIGKKGKNQISMKEVDIEVQKEYAVEDADITFQLKQIMEEELVRNKLFKLFNEVEMPLLKVLFKMEIEGINLDVSSLDNLSKQLEEEIASKENSIFSHAGKVFNVSSPKQLGYIIYEELKLVEKPKKTKTGQYSTAENIIQKLKTKHPIISDILDYRQLQKLKSTYVDALPKEVNQNTGRIHTLFSQTVAATGRLSSNNPNLQNIPIRTTLGKQVRKAFISRNKDFLLVSADYSQIELRLIASLSKDSVMISSFLNGEDIHASTASKVFGVPINKVTKEQRSHAKTVNFGIIYGVSASGLSEQTSLSRKESKELIDSYFHTYPKIKKYIESQIQFAREKGYVETILGRKRHLRDINSQNHIVRGHAERIAINAPIQGSAADIIKLAMINIQSRLDTHSLKSKMLLQIHDELVFDAAIDELDTIIPIIRNQMQKAYKLDVPLVADLGYGNNWLEAH